MGSGNDFLVRVSNYDAGFAFESLREIRLGEPCQVPGNPSSNSIGLSWTLAAILWLVPGFDPLLGRPGIGYTRRRGGTFSG